jgi:hypothetical protein
VEVNLDRSHTGFDNNFGATIDGTTIDGTTIGGVVIIGVSFAGEKEQ